MGQKGRIREFCTKDPEKSKLSTHRAIRRGPYSEYDTYGKYNLCKEYSTYGKYGMYSEYDTYGEYNFCKEYSTYGKYGMYSEYNMYGEYDSCKEYSTYGKYGIYSKYNTYGKYDSCVELQSCSTYHKYNTYSKYNKYGKTYDKVAKVDDQAPNPKRGGAKKELKDAVKTLFPGFPHRGFLQVLLRLYRYSTKTGINLLLEFKAFQ